MFLLQLKIYMLSVFHIFITYLYATYAKNINLTSTNYAQHFATIQFNLIFYVLTRAGNHAIT